MFERWYVLKFAYVSPAMSVPQTKILAYMHLGDAEQIFRKLELSYQYDAPVRLNGDVFIKVTNASLYESFEFYRKDAIEDVEIGKCNLIFEAKGIDIDLKEPSVAQ